MGMTAIIFMKFRASFFIMVRKYIRYSTMSQDEQEQNVIISNWCRTHGLQIDKEYVDKGTSGKIEWTNRNLAKLVADLEPGDVIIASEASRISRSIADFHNFVNETIRKRKARIVVCNMNLDIDCTNLNAMTELTFSMLAFAAQMERELISQRTKAALDARKQTIKQMGGFTSKNGNWCTHLGAPEREHTAEAQKRHVQRRKERIEARLPEVAEKILQLNGMGLSSRAIAKTMNESGYKTEDGKVWQHTKVIRILKLYTTNEA